MQTLAEDDFRALDHALGRLYASGLTTETYIPRCFEAIQTLVASDLYAYGQRNLKHGTLEISLSTTPPGAAEALLALSRSMWKYKLHDWDPMVNGGRPFCRGDFFSRREYRNTDVFSDTMRPMCLTDHMAILVPDQAGEVVFFGIERSGNIEFSERDRSVVTLLQTHLANARSLALERASMPEFSQERVVERLRRVGLSQKEAQTLYWVLEGKSNEEIALIQRVRVTTVKTHVGNFFEKLGVENRLAAVRVAFRIAMEPEPFRHVGPSIAFSAGRLRNRTER